MTRGLQLPKVRGTNRSFEKPPMVAIRQAPIAPGGNHKRLYKKQYSLIPVLSKIKIPKKVDFRLLYF